jgi:tetratricopeptide (TPR) repeat protein
MLAIASSDLARVLVVALVDHLLRGVATALWLGGVVGTISVLVLLGGAAIARQHRSDRAKLVPPLVSEATLVAQSGTLGADIVALQDAPVAVLKGAATIDLRQPTDGDEQKTSSDESELSLRVPATTPDEPELSGEPAGNATLQEETPARTSSSFVPRVFMSHSSADNAFGIQLAHRLRLALGSIDAVFYDTDGGPEGGLVGADVWLDRLQHEITERNVFVLVLSPAAFASPWVTKELRLALRQAVSVGSKVLVPVLYLQTPIWPFLSDYQMVRFVPRTPGDPPIPFEDAFAELLDAVREGESRLVDLQAMRAVRLGPPFDIEQLPQPPRFVGREADVKWALRQLAPEPVVEDRSSQPTHPQGVRSAGVACITAVNGLAGIGKSALAGQIVRILFAENRFPDGIAVVLCNGQRDPAAVLRQVLARFDPQGREPDDPTLRALQGRAKVFFADRQSLVVLDNIEPEWPVERVIAPLRAAGVAVLATSRVRLPDAAVPAEGSRELELLAPEEALDLFAEYYGRGAALELTPPERQAARRITHALGYHTLAVKLAATHARAQRRDLTQAAKEYEADLREGIHLRDGREAVAVVLEESVVALPARAQHLFAALAAFATSDVGRAATLALARSLPPPSLVQGRRGQGDPDLGAGLDAMLDLRLVDAYVLDTLPTDGDRERVRLHPLVRVYAEQCFARWEVQARNDARQAVADWYAEYVATKAGPDIIAEFVAAQSSLVLAADEANITSALEWAHDRGEANLVVQLCCGMDLFWRDRGNTSASLRYLPWAVADAEVRLKEMSAEDVPPETLDAWRARADTLFWLVLNEGFALFVTGKLKDAEQRYTCCLDLASKARLRRNEGAALNVLGQIALKRGQPEEAEDYFKRSLAIHREPEVMHRQGEGAALSSLGQIALERGRQREAEKRFRESREYFGEAEEHFRESLKTFREVGDRQDEGVVLFQLAMLAERKGNQWRAEILLRGSLAIANEMQDGQGIADTCAHLGEFLISRRGKREEGCEMLAEAVRWYDQMGTLRANETRERAHQLGCDQSENAPDSPSPANEESRQWL